MIHAAGLHDFKPQGPLNPDWYRLRIQNAKAAGENVMVVRFMVTDGPTQDDDSDPQGKTFSGFFITGGYDRHKDGGEFARGSLRSLLDAARVEVDEDDNFEEEELIDQEVNGFVTAGVDNRTGQPREQVNLFSAVDED